MSKAGCSRGKGERELLPEGDYGGVNVIDDDAPNGRRKTGRPLVGEDRAPVDQLVDVDDANGFAVEVPAAVGVLDRGDAEAARLGADLLYEVPAGGDVERWTVALIEVAVEDHQAVDGLATAGVDLDD